MQVIDIGQLRIGEYDSRLYARSLATVAAFVDDPHIWRRVQNGLKTAAGRDRIPSEILPAVDESQALWRLNKSVQDPEVRQRIAATIAATERTHLPMGQPCSSTAANGARLATFHRDGIVELPPLLSDLEIAEVIAHLQAHNEATSENNLRHHDVKTIVRAPHIVRAVSAPWLLDLVEGFLEMPPTLVDLSLWESQPGNAEPSGAQIFHRDRDDFRSCKLFVYLNDIGPECGPHIFVKGSHKPAEIKARVPGIAEATISSLFRNDGRKVAAEIEDLFGAAVTEVTGPAGATFLENTYGFHRGKVPTAGSRLILQAMYACIPYAQRISHMAAGRLDQLPPDCVDTPRIRHTLRLLI